jgi:hypothetical protein
VEFVVVEIQSSKGRELGEVESIQRGELGVGYIENGERVRYLRQGGRSEFEERDIIVRDIQNRQAWINAQMNGMEKIVIGIEFFELWQGVDDGNVRYVVPPTVK